MKLKMLYIAAVWLSGSIGLLSASGAARAQGNEGPAQALARETAQAHHRKGAHGSSAPVTTMPAPVPTQTAAQTPLRPSQMPAVAPRISYADGKLTVIAENSTLGDILNSIHNATGMQIESSGGNAGERVAAKIGPGTVREVLLAVLEGSHYDYILLGSESNPGNIDKVILTPKSTATGVATAVGAAPSRPADENADDDNAEGFAQPQPAAETPSPASGTPGATAGPTVKTPEQLLEDLRRLEQQRRAQNPGAQGTQGVDTPPRPPNTPPE